jgi:hypothetical protein
MNNAAEWTECDIFDLDLAVDASRRLAALPTTVRAREVRLLEGMLDTFPLPPEGVVELVAGRLEAAILDEIRGLAMGIGVPFEDLVLATVSYELVIASLGCSTMALATPDGPLLARNLDWWPEELLARATCHLRMVREERLLFSAAGFPSTVGVVTGQSSRGFAVAINAVGSGEAPNLDGEPILLLVRRVLEHARDFSDAVEILSSAPLVVSVLVTVVGSTNLERVVIERTARRAEQRRAAGDTPLLATNDYRAMKLPVMQAVLGATACDRYDSMARLLDDHGDLGDERILGVLSHPRVRQAITAQHVIMRPSLGRMRVCVPTRLMDQS